MPKKVEMHRHEDGGWIVECDGVRIGMPIPRVEDAAAIKKWVESAKHEFTMKNKRPYISTAPTHVLWEVYRVETEKVHGASPIHAGAKTAGQLMNLVKQYGLEPACEIVRFYLSLKKPHYLQRKHDLGTLLLEAHGITMEMQGAKQVTQAEAKNLDRYQANLNAIRSYRDRG